MKKLLFVSALCLNVLGIIREVRTSESLEIAADQASPPPDLSSLTLENERFFQYPFFNPTKQNAILNKYNHRFTKNNLEFKRLLLEGRSKLPGHLYQSIRQEIMYAYFEGFPMCTPEERLFEVGHYLNTHSLLSKSEAVQLAAFLVDYPVIHHLASGDKYYALSFLQASVLLIAARQFNRAYNCFKRVTELFLERLAYPCCDQEGYLDTVLDEMLRTFEGCKFPSFIPNPYINGYAIFKLLQSLPQAHVWQNNMRHHDHLVAAPATYLFYKLSTFLSRYHEVSISPKKVK